MVVAVCHCCHFVDALPHSYVEVKQSLFKLRAIGIQVEMAAWAGESVFACGGSEFSTSRLCCLQ